MKTSNSSSIFLNIILACSFLTYAQELNSWSFYDSAKSFYSTYIPKYVIKTVSVLVASASILALGLYGLIKYEDYQSRIQDHATKKLIEAIEKNDFEGVQKYIAQANVNNIWISKAPLIIACEKGNFRIIELLLLNKADPNISNWVDSTPLQIAVNNNQLNIAEILLKHGADPHPIRTRDEPPLMVATKNNNPEMIKLLITYEANIHKKEEKKGEYGTRVYHDWGHSSYTPPKQYSCFEIAVENDSVEALNQLLLYVPKNERSTLIQSLYRQAIKQNKKKILKSFIENPEIGINMEFDDGDFPLMVAINECKKEAIEFMYSYKPELNRYNKSGNTPLIQACYLNEIDIALSLLEKGAVLEMTDQKGHFTPLQTAITHGYEDLTKTLFYFGASMQTNPIQVLKLKKEVPAETRVRLTKIINEPDPRKKILQDEFIIVNKALLDYKLNRSKEAQHKTLYQAFNDISQMQERSIHDNIKRIDAFKPALNIISGYLGIDDARLAYF